jgi:hypothetical protein
LFTSFLFQAGLLSAVIAAFVAPKFQDLQVNPAQQAVYYQQQSTQMIAQISQQIAGTQVPLDATPIRPYPTFHPSVLDRLVTVLWLLSLVCSLSAALLSALVQQWVRLYMRVHQQSSSPLQKARTRQYLYEGVESLPAVAEAAPGLVHISLILFLLGLGTAVLKTDIVVGITTVVPIVCCGYIYLYSVIAPISNPQSPYHNPFSELILLVIQYRHRGSPHDRSRSIGVWPARMEVRQEMPGMREETERQALDVRALQWLAGHIREKDDMETFVLATSSIFKQAWGRELWEAFFTRNNFQADARGTQLTPPPEGTTVDGLCRHVRRVFEVYTSEGAPMAQRTRMHGCIETVASLVCCADVPFDRFGEVGEVLSHLGPTDGINKLSTIKSGDASFVVPWTCLSLVAIRHMVVVDRNRIRELVDFAVSAVDRIAPIRRQLDHANGSSEPDASEVVFEGANGIDELLKTAWRHVEGLSRAFNPWDQYNSAEGEEIRNTLRVERCEFHISELERIGDEANGMDDVDLWISLLQDTMDKVTHKLTQRLPGVSFDELKPPGKTRAIATISDAFDFPIFESTPITPQFLLPGQRLQSLSTLGRKCRDIIENRNLEQLVLEIVEDMKSIDRIPIPLRRLKDLMIRQVWRLQDLRDGGGRGFTTELFFHALRPLSSAPSSPEFKRAFYIGTFKAITSGWENITNFSGTQRILLNLICDLVIKGRGVFSDFPYPEYIVDSLLELVKKMVDKHGNAHPQIRDAMDELRGVHPRDMDQGLCDKVLQALGQFSLPMDSTA